MPLGGLLEIIALDKVYDRVALPTISQPFLALQTLIVVVTGELPIPQVPHIAMLDRVVVNVVETCPQVSLSSDATIPIIMPNLPAYRAVLLIDLARGAAVKPSEESKEGLALLGFEDHMVVVIKDYPGKQGEAEFRHEFL